MASYLGLRLRIHHGRDVSTMVHRLADFLYLHLGIALKLLKLLQHRVSIAKFDERECSLLLNVSTSSLNTHLILDVLQARSPKLRPHKNPLTLSQAIFHPVHALIDDNQIAPQETKLGQNSKI